MTDFFPPRQYRDTADLEAIKQVLRRGILSACPEYSIHPGDIQWWLFYPPIGEDLLSRTWVWENPDRPGELLAWMLVDPSWPSFELFVVPEIYAGDLHREMLSWAEREALRLRRPDAENLNKLWVAEGDAFQRGWLESRGFRASSADTFFLRPLADAVTTPDIPGWTIRRCRGMEELEARARAQHGAFQSSSPLDAYFRRWEQLMRSAAYAGALDVVAANPAGQIGAFCIAWEDAHLRRGYLEPVGTHPDFQRRGLGRSVLIEAFRLLRERGMVEVSVCTSEDNAPAQGLYTSLGFRPAGRLFLYKKYISLPV